MSTLSILNVRSIVDGHVAIGLGVIAAGFLAMSTVKGSRAHKLAGRLFVTAMFCMAITGFVLVTVAPPRAMLTAWAALPGFYLALTGWLSARRQSAGAGASEITGACVAGFMCVSGLVLAATAKQASIPALLTGSAIAFLFASADLAITLRGGLMRSERIRRHLWRISSSVVIATAAVFVAQTQRFPHPLRPYLPFMVLPPLAFTLVQLFRYRAQRRPIRPLPGQSPAANTPFFLSTAGQPPKIRGRG